jgi:hypothetical protein
LVEDNSVTRRSLYFNTLNIASFDIPSLLFFDLSLAPSIVSFEEDVFQYSCRLMFQAFFFSLIAALFSLPAHLSSAEDPPEPRKQSSPSKPIK